MRITITTTDEQQARLLLNVHTLARCIDELDQNLRSWQKYGKPEHQSEDERIVYLRELLLDAIRIMNE